MKLETLKVPPFEEKNTPISLIICEPNILKQKLVLIRLKQQIQTLICLNVSRSALITSHETRNPQQKT